MTSVNWHNRFTQQAHWTESLRAYAFTNVGLSTAKEVLEVGCGTGAILAGLKTSASLHGLDIEPAHLIQALSHAPKAHLTCGDAHNLPYLSHLFDITFCHYLLLWVNDPLKVLTEMKRVTRQDGYVLALAEPDYRRRIDQPSELAKLGQLQTESLRHQGANPDIGGQLKDLFIQAGIHVLESGELARRVNDSPTPEEWELEWDVLEYDLSEPVSEVDLKKYKSIDKRAWETGKRQLYIPTHFAWGRV